LHLIADECVHLLIFQVVDVSLFNFVHSICLWFC